MADMSGEAAFLASMGGAEYDPASYDPAESAHPEEEQDGEEEEEEEDDEDYDPSSFMPDAAQVQTSATPQPALSQPQSQPPSQQPSRTASRMSDAAPAQKPKTIGGFIEEEDDDDEEQEQGRGTNGSLAQTPVQQQQNVQALYNPPPTEVLEQDHAPSVLPQQGAVVQGHTTSQSNIPPPSTVQTQTSVPQPRLPQDRVGQLEDRIADDPKGDIDAWLDLISLHKSKNKLTDARKTYNRFFEVFPTAVGSSSLCLVVLD